MDVQTKSGVYHSPIVKLVLLLCQKWIKTVLPGEEMLEPNS